MFEGKAEEAMNFYVSLFPASSTTSVIRYKPGEAGNEGTIMVATFLLNGQQFMCIDSSVKHPFSFTPAMSLYITCEDENEIDTLFSALSDGGSVLMPLGDYPFSKKYAWVSDRYGVSWQLSFNG